ncbi:Hsp20/alpha crystallin family protein [Streptomyces flavofungini]|uniref:Hsp20/alpha crystallin family protein n=1 Tax=Streptomyces flavofungini TaxID=68200 RepID=UPI0034DEF4E1
MLMRTDPFRDLDRFAQQLFAQSAGTWSKPSQMPMDAYRDGEAYVIALDLPGVDPDAIDIDVERNMLTVKAERRPARTGEGTQMELAERPMGVFSRQVMLADTLDTEAIDATFDAGVLTLRIPIAERAKPRKISISPGASAGAKRLSA